MFSLVCDGGTLSLTDAVLLQWDDLNLADSTWSDDLDKALAVLVEEPPPVATAPSGHEHPTNVDAVRKACDELIASLASPQTNVAAAVKGVISSADAFLDKSFSKEEKQRMWLDTVRSQPARHDGSQTPIAWAEEALQTKFGREVARFVAASRSGVADSGCSAPFIVAVTAASGGSPVHKAAGAYLKQILLEVFRVNGPLVACLESMCAPEVKQPDLATKIDGPTDLRLSTAIVANNAIGNFNRGRAMMGLGTKTGPVPLFGDIRTVHEWETMAATDPQFFNGLGICIMAFYQGNRKTKAILLKALRPANSRKAGRRDSCLAALLKGGGPFDDDCTRNQGIFRALATGTRTLVVNNSAVEVPVFIQEVTEPLPTRKFKFKRIVGGQCHIQLAMQPATLLAVFPLIVMLPHPLAQPKRRSDQLPSTAAKRARLASATK